MADDAQKSKRSAQEEQWLAKRLQAARQKQFSPPTIPAREPSPTAPLSTAQERLWFLHQLQPDTNIYNISTALRISGSLDAVLLRKAIQAIITRHEILHTTYTVEGGKPVQVVADNWSFELPLTDLTGFPEDQRESEANQLMMQESRYDFDLSQDLMLRAHLYRLQESEHLLFLLTHHIASDSWSRDLFYKELNALYAAYIEERSPGLPDLPIQYADYAIWQRNDLDKESSNQDFQYWKEKLRDLPPVLQMPADYVRPKVLDYHAGRVTSSLSSALVDALQDVSRDEGATLFMVLLAAFSLLLYRLTGEEDILVGAPVAGRNWKEVEKLIGIFLGSLVLRNDLSGNITFRELLRRVRCTTLEAFDHQNIPVERLIEEFEPNRDLSRTPLFQVFLNMIVLPKPDLDNPQNSMVVEPLTEAGSNFDITLYVRDSEHGLELKLVYRASLYKHERMRELLDQYLYLLDQIANDPDQPIDSMSLLTKTGKEGLPDPGEPLSSAWYGAVHAKVNEWAKFTPGKMAIVDSTGSYTYQELDEGAARLANFLVDKGIEKGDVVAVYGHRCGALVGAILGILKTGAAFLILDPAYPIARNKRILKLAKPKVILQVESKDRIPESLTKLLPGLIYFTLFKDWSNTPAFQKYSPDSPDIRVGPGDLACIGFTSGSTGQPKGIIGLHGSLSHFLPWQTDRFDLCSRDNFSLLSGLSTDPLQRDIFTTWWVGGKLCIPDQENMGKPGYLAGWMAEKEISFSHLTPPMGLLIAESASDEQTLPMLRYAFFTGDKLKRSDVSRFRRIAPDVSCINSYGATETQRAVGFFIVPDDSYDDPSQKPSYPIGKGMPDVQLIILNKNGQIAGIGEIGEIHVRSPHLARGYLGDSELTAARFIVNPYTRDTNDRLYRTGDLGRYLPGGVVEFSGRADRQIKVRGFRVESGEIEATLLRFPGIRQAFIDVYEESNQGQRLIAYIVSAAEEHPPTRELRSFLQKHLPEFMVPSVFVNIDALPVSPSGKVDQRALPEVFDTGPDLNFESAAPNDQIEFQIIQIWKHVLGIDHVRLEDNFFELGGHSLLGARMLAQVDKMFGKDLPLMTLFQAPTVAQLAVIIRESGYSVGSTSLVMIKPGDTQPPLFFIPGNLGNVFIDLGDLAHHLDTDQSFYGLQDGQQNPSKIEAVAKKYIDEICVVQSQGPYFLGGICSGAIIAYEMAQQLRKKGQEIKLLALVEPVYPFTQSFRSYVNFLERISSKVIQRIDPALGSESQLSMMDDGIILGLKFKLVRNSFALRQYAAKKYPGEVHIFHTKETSEKSARKFQLDWQELVSGSLRYNLIPGTHDSITGNNSTKIDEFHMKALAEQLKFSLEEIEGS